jgi:hypothetical protein
LIPGIDDKKNRDVSLVIKKRQVGALFPVREKKKVEKCLVVCAIYSTFAAKLSTN